MLAIKIFSLLFLIPLNNSLGNLKFGYDAESQKYGYYATDSEGADTFCPFSEGIDNLINLSKSHVVNTDSRTTSYKATSDCIILAISASSGGYGSITYSGEYTTLFAFNDNSYYVRVSFALVKVKIGTTISLSFSNNTAGLNSIYVII